MINEQMSAAEFMALEARDLSRMIYKPIKNKDPQTKDLCPWLTGHESVEITAEQRTDLNDLIRIVSKLRKSQTDPKFIASLMVLGARLKTRRRKR